MKVNLVECVQSEGIVLKRIGNAYRSICPFHDEKHPSFYVYPDSNRFICYGCGEKGDAIDFIRKLKGFTFKEALSYLGLNGNNMTMLKIQPRQNKRRRRRQSFNQWCSQNYDDLATEYRCIHKVIRSFRSMEEVEQNACLYHRLPILEWHLDILLHGDGEEKFDLYQGEDDGF